MKPATAIWLLLLLLAVVGVPAFVRHPAAVVEGARSLVRAFTALVIAPH